MKAQRHMALRDSGQCRNTQFFAAMYHPAQAQSMLKRLVRISLQGGACKH